MIASRNARNREWALVGAIVLLAAAIRLPALLGDGLWRDEANVYVQVSAPTLTEFFSRVIATEWHPPLYFLLMYGWTRLAGDGEFALTVVPFVFSCATVPVVYLLGTSIAGTRVGRVAAALFAVAPGVIAYAGEYVYPVMLFFCTLLALLVVRARDRPLRAARWVMLGCVTLLVVATHYIGLLYIPLLLIWTFSARAGMRRKCAIATALIAGMLPFLLWLPVFLGQRQIGVPYSSVATLPQRAVFCVRTLVDAAPIAPTPLALVFVAFIFVALYAIARAGQLQRDPLALALMYPTIVIALATQNLLAGRYALPFYGLACVFLSWVITRFAALVDTSHWAVARRWGSRVFVGLAVLVVGWNVAGAIARSQVPKSGIRSIVYDRARDERTLYLIAPDYLASTFAFYARHTGVKAAGFVRWERPELFRQARYTADWNRADVVRRTLSSVASADHRIAFLDVVVDDGAHDSGHLPYGKVALLVDDLRNRYRLLSRTPHPGRYESVSEYRFALSHP